MVHKTYYGGVAIHVKEVSNELKKHKISTEEITRNEDLNLKSFITSYFKIKSLAKNWSKNYDIIHSHDWSITYPIIKAGVKNLVASFHAFPTNPIANYFENYCIKKLGKFAIVVSPLMKRVYKNATYIPNGVNIKLFKPNPNIKRERLLCGIAQKYNKQKIINTIQKVKLDWISTEGKLPYNKLPEFYSKIGIFISIPYKQAGFNLVWLEAMACEVPYIIGTNAGIGEILPIIKVSNFEELRKILEEIKNYKIEPLKNQRDWIIRNKLTWKEHVK